MAISLSSHSATDGSELYTIVSVSAIRSLTTVQVQALAKLNIRRVSELFTYMSIHDQRLISDSSRGQIAHDTILTDLVDAAFHNVAAIDLLSEKLVALEKVDNETADVFKVAFGITTIQQLADFRAFQEALQFLQPADGVF